MANSEKPLHIAFLGPTSSVHVLNLARNLSAKGLKISIISGDRHKTEKLANIHFHSFSSTENFLSKISQIQNILKKIKPDIIHSHFVNHGGYIGLCSGFHPHVVSAWGCDVLNIPFESLLHRALVPLTLRSADYLLPVSLELKETIDRLGYSPEKNEVLSWGVDTEVFSPLNQDKTLRSRFAIPQDSFFILSPRGIQPVYNHEMILAGFALFLKKHPDAILGMLRFGIIDDNYFESLKNLIEDLKISKNVVWLDSLSSSQMPHLYNAADVMVSLAGSDGTPMTVQEAMACARPVIASDLKTIQEWVIPLETGFLSPISADGLCSTLDTMKKTNSSVLEKIQKNARQKIISEANAEKNVHRFIAIYEELAKKQNPGISLKETFKNISKISLQR